MRFQFAGTARELQIGWMLLDRRFLEDAREFVSEFLEFGKQFRRHGNFQFLPNEYFSALFLQFDAETAVYKNRGGRHQSEATTRDRSQNRRAIASAHTQRALIRRDGD